MEQSIRIDSLPSAVYAGRSMRAPAPRMVEPTPVPEPTSIALPIPKPSRIREIEPREKPVPLWIPKPKPAPDPSTEAVAKVCGWCRLSTDGHCLRHGGLDEQTKARARYKAWRLAHPRIPKPKKPKLVRKPLVTRVPFCRYCDRGFRLIDDAAHKDIVSGQLIACRRALAKWAKLAKQADSSPQIPAVGPLDAPTSHDQASTNTPLAGPSLSGLETPVS